VFYLDLIIIKNLPLLKLYAVYGVPYLACIYGALGFIAGGLFLLLRRQKKYNG